MWAVGLVVGGGYGCARWVWWWVAGWGGGHIWVWWWVGVGGRWVWWWVAGRGGGQLLGCQGWVRVPRLWAVGLVVS